MTGPLPGEGESPLIVALGPVDPLVGERLAAFGTVVVAQGREELELVLPRAVGIVARGSSVVDAELLDAAPKLRVIGRSGVGVELIDLQAATRRGIPVVVTPGSGAEAVAEATFALALHLVKRLGRFTSLVREGKWEERERLIAGDLAGATLGVVGFGRIGRRVAELGIAFRMRVVATDPYVPARAAAVVGVELMPLEGLVESADVISLHAPLTSESAGLLGRGLLKRAGPGAVLVNCGRGGLLDLDAAYEALLEGRLSGVGLDVYDPEPPRDHPLFHHPDVVLTPHVAGLSRRARLATFEQMAEGMAEVLAGGRAKAVANPEVYAG